MKVPAGQALALIPALFPGFGQEVGIRTVPPSEAVMPERADTQAGLEQSLAPLKHSVDVGSEHQHVG